MTPLARKLQLKASSLALIMNAPASFISQLEPLPEHVALAFQPIDNVKYDYVQLFVTDSHALKKSLVTLIPFLKPESVFWISYPKKNSGIPTDLEAMQSWEALGRYGYDGVSAAAIDERWTALRWKPASHVKRSESGNENIPRNEYGNYIDLEKREIRLPDELAAALSPHPTALQFFQGLSFTNRKEYVVWILSAKQDKTKRERLAKTVVKLLNGKKNPSQK